MISVKGAKRILRQYGKHIKASEEKVGKSIELASKYDCEGYKELSMRANK